MQEVTDNINTLSELKISHPIEGKLMVAAFLDLKKHYSMCILNSLFMHMLNEDLDMIQYENIKNACIKDISNFYSLILDNKINEPSNISEEVLDIFSNSRYPLSAPPSIYKPEGEPAARRLIMREMDHPAQIILFAGNLLNQDKDDPLDIIVNPLSGALEIGYALKSIYELIGLDKINEVFLVKYSHYGEGDIGKSSLDFHVPKKLMQEINQIDGQRVMIIDDNTFTGETLCHLRNMFYPYTDKVGMAAIERTTLADIKTKTELTDLEISPISKLRYIERVIQYIKSNNLHCEEI